MKLSKNDLRKLINEISSKDILLKEDNKNVSNLKFFIDNPHSGTEKAIHGNVLGEDPVYLIRMLAGSVYSLKQRVKVLEEKLEQQRP